MHIYQGLHRVTRQPGVIQGDQRGPFAHQTRVSTCERTHRQHYVARQRLAARLDFHPGRSICLVGIINVQARAALKNDADTHSVEHTARLGCEKQACLIRIRVIIQYSE